MTLDCLIKFGADATYYIRLFLFFWKKKEIHFCFHNFFRNGKNWAGFDLPHLGCQPFFHRKNNMFGFCLTVNAASSVCIVDVLSSFNSIIRSSIFSLWLLFYIVSRRSTCLILIRLINRMIVFSSFLILNFQMIGYDNFFLEFEMQIFTTNFQLKFYGICVIR